MSCYYTFGCDRMVWCTCWNFPRLYVAATMPKQLQLETFEVWLIRDRHGTTRLIFLYPVSAHWWDFNHETWTNMAYLTLVSTQICTRNHAGLPAVWAAWYDKSRSYFVWECPQLPDFQFSKNFWLVGGLGHVSFFHVLGIIPSELNIFERVFQPTSWGSWLTWLLVLGCCFSTDLHLGFYVGFSQNGRNWQKQPLFFNQVIIGDYIYIISHMIHLAYSHKSVILYNHQLP